MKSLADLKFDSNGLIPAIAQDHRSGRVLMVAWMNELSLRRTIESGKAHYWSRSRATLWFKGEESGHVQIVQEIRTDCDRDVLLLSVEQVGGVACHDGYESCFYRRLEGDSWVTVETPRVDPKQVYKKK